MRLVNSGTERLLRAWVFEFVDFGLWGVPEAGVVDRRFCQVLCDILDPGGDSFNPFVGVRDD
jgi:hypothetical protein